MKLHTARRTNVNVKDVDRYLGSIVLTYYTWLADILNTSSGSKYVLRYEYLLAVTKQVTTGKSKKKKSVFFPMSFIYLTFDFVANTI